MTDVNAGGAPEGAAGTDNAGLATADAGAGTSPNPGVGTSPNPGVGTGQGEQFSFDWGKAGLDDTALGYVQNKGWAGAKDVVESYRNLEKVTGAPPEQIIKLPKDNDPAMMDEAYRKMGWPEKAENYTVKMPEQGGDPEFAKLAAGWFHEAKLNQSQVDAVVAKWNEHVTGMAEQQNQELAQRDAQQIAELKKEWGPNEQSNTVLVDRAAEQFGMTQEELTALKQAMGPGRAMKFLHNIGSKMGTDDTFVNNNDVPGGGFNRMSPQQAMSEIAELRQDKGFLSRFASNDRDAKAQMERLHKIAYPEG